MEAAFVQFFSSESRVVISELKSGIQDWWLREGSRVFLKIKQPTMLYQDENEYQHCVASFLDDCNTPNALGCTWIVRVREGCCRCEAHSPVIARIAFESHDKHVFVVDNFLDWWENVYLKFNSSKNQAWVEIFTNFTPTEICVPRIEYWLHKNQNVRRLTIHFAFVYTWSEGRRRAPIYEYVSRLRNLARFPHSSVRIRKINSCVLLELAKQACVNFPGYRNPSYSNDFLEPDIITHY